MLHSIEQLKSVPIPLCGLLSNKVQTSASTASDSLFSIPYPPGLDPHPNDGLRSNKKIKNMPLSRNSTSSPHPNDVPPTKLAVNSVSRTQASTA